LVRGQAIATTTTTTTKQAALERKGDFAVHASVYGKVQAGLTPTSDGQEKEKEKEEKEERRGLPVLPELGYLATHILCIGDISCKSWQKIFIINNIKSS